MQEINKRLFNWASVLEDNTREQAERTSTMPFIFPHVALMPDAHLGKGATVGSVIPTDGAIIPAAVGVDLGCGMQAIRTQFTTTDFDRINFTLRDGTKNSRRLREAIESTIPLSAGKYNQKLTDSAAKRINKLHDLAYEHGDFDPDFYAENWDNQLGSLGSGNHFIEIVTDEQDRIWMFLHSGSRGIGNKIAQHHIRKAKDMCETFFIDLPDPDLAYLPVGTDEFGKYFHEMQWAQRFAWLNREEMMDRVQVALSEWMDEDVVRQQEVHCHHNYTEMEKHFGKNVFLTRKGAIRARRGDLGLIPGSMGTASYVVEGLGNPLSLDSAPHGAGRVHSRRSARNTFTAEQLQVLMDERDVEWSGNAKAFLDEIPTAYKDVDVVMRDAGDLVKIVHTFRQRVNVKGS